MPKRPRPHVLKDLARARHRDAFARAGWAVEDLASDYGEDMLVCIFEAEAATPLAFFVQSKATDKIARYRSIGGTTLSYPIKSDHIKHWKDFWEPVILTVWDSQADVTYWECIQTFLEDQTKGKSNNQKETSTLTVSIPTDNRFDEEGLRRIAFRTRNRFARFEREQVGAQHLIDFLKDHLGIEIDYGPQPGILLVPKGKFVPDPSGGRVFVAFGKCAAALKRVERKFGVKAEDFFHGSLNVLRQVAEAYASGGRVVMADSKTGRVEKSWETLEELIRHVKRETELDKE